MVCVFIKLKAFFMCIELTLFVKLSLETTKPASHYSVTLRGACFLQGRSGEGRITLSNQGTRASLALSVMSTVCVSARCRAGSPVCSRVPSASILQSLNSPLLTALHWLKGFAFFFFKPEDAQINLLKVYGFKVISFENQKLSFSAEMDGMWQCSF